MQEICRGKVGEERKLEWECGLGICLGAERKSLKNYLSLISDTHHQIFVVEWKN